jgi:type VI secretion system protein ImpG
VDSRLLYYFNRELQHLREVGGEFAKEFPKIAGRLGLDEFACVDPYVERLLEGFAFLAARVRLKLDAEFPRFTQSLLETVYPHYLAPTPSMLVARFEPDLTNSALADGFLLPRDTVLRSIIGKGEQTACEYRTGHDVTLWPIRVAEAQFHTQDLATLEVPQEFGAKGGIRIRIQCTAGLVFSELKLDSLNFFLRGSDETPMRIYEQLFANTVGVVIQSSKRPVKWREVLSKSSIRPVGFDDGQAMLPYGPRSFQGYRLLKEYFAFPQRYMFVELAGLAGTVQHCQESELDIVILLKDSIPELEGRVDATTFALFCSPAANLFPKRADRIHLSDRFSEFHVVPDRTRPLDFEVYEVLRVIGHGATADEEQEFLPFYSASDLDAQGGGAGAYYAVGRVPRAASAREKQFGRRATYAGSEIYLSLVDSKESPYRADLRQLEVVTKCTNRDLPLQMPVGVAAADFTMDVDAPVESIRCLSGPTSPRPSPAEGEVAWRAISHLSLNYFSLADADEEEGASALRDILKLYGDNSDPQIRKQIDGVRRITTRPIIRRIGRPGPIAFARGLEVTLTLDEAAFEGTGVFLLGAVLDRFFANYVSINSFTETVVKTLQRGEVIRWPARTGQRQTL